MVRCLPATLVLMTWLVGLTAAQAPATGDPKKDEVKKTVSEAGKATPAASKSEPTDVEVHFINGSLLRLLVYSEKLDIDTDYGRLSVPVRDIRSIEFGLRFPDGVAAKIDAAVNDLGGNEFRSRDKAVKTLVELGPYSYSAVLDARKSKNLETSKRAKDVLTQLESKFAKKDLRVTELDKVVARSYPITGRILTSSFKARTDLFGDVELALAKMSTLRSVAGPSAGVDATVMLDAAKYAIAGQWLETSIEADSRSILTITAKGAVDTWPQGPNQYMSGPNGVQGGRMLIQGGIVLGGGRNAGAVNLQMNGGALYGRIGTDGEPFFIGERFHDTPSGDGTLYLTIAPSPWQCLSTGKYEVKIAR